MSAYPAVKIDGCFVADNTYSSDGKVWNVTNPIARAMNLEPFDLPLAAIYSARSGLLSVRPKASRTTSNCCCCRCSAKGAPMLAPTAAEVLDRTFRAFF